MASEVLAGARILVVEDEYYLADDACSIFSQVGADVAGPVPTVDEATAKIESDERIDCVLLDVNLRGEMAFDLADMLKTRGVPFAFVTGYNRAALPDRFAATPALGKPVDPARLIKLFEKLTVAPRGVA